MRISVEHREDAKYPEFTVHLHGSTDEPFLSIKGCSVREGDRGRFVSWPARKLESGKWWRFIYATDAFQTAILVEHDKTIPAPKPAKSLSQPKRESVQRVMDEDDVPF